MNLYDDTGTECSKHMCHDTMLLANLHFSVSDGFRCFLVVSLTPWFQLIDCGAHLLYFILCQVNISRSPVLLQSRWARGTRNGDHTLSSHPCERNLRHRAASTVRKLLEALANLFVCVEVLALELRNWDGYVSMK